MKTIKYTRGIVEPLTLVIIVICICVGGYFALQSKVIDSPEEQTAEAILRAEGIDVDFSAEKKQEVKDAKGIPQVQSKTD